MFLHFLTNFGRRLKSRIYHHSVRETRITNKLNVTKFEYTNIAVYNFAFYNLSTSIIVVMFKT